MRTKINFEPRKVTPVEAEIKGKKRTVNITEGTKVVLYVSGVSKSDTIQALYDCISGTQQLRAGTFTVFAKDVVLFPDDTTPLMEIIEEYSIQNEAGEYIFDIRFM